MLSSVLLAIESVAPVMRIVEQSHNFAPVGSNENNMGHVMARWLQIQVFLPKYPCC